MPLSPGVTGATVVALSTKTTPSSPIAVSVSIAPSEDLTDISTGTRISAMIETLVSGPGKAQKILVPHSSQAGFRNDRGEAVSDWHYVATITYTAPGGRPARAPKTRIFRLPAGQTEVTLENLPAAVPATIQPAPDIRAGVAIIAASNAPASWKKAATLICSGTDDQVQINQLINTGPVQLSPGLFNIADEIVVTAKHPALTGSGWATSLRAVDAMNKYMIRFAPADGDGVRGSFRDFMLDCNGTNQTAGGGIHAIGAVQTIFENIWFTNPWENALWLDSFLGGGTGAFGHHNKVKSCLFDCTTAFAGIGRGMLILGNDENEISSEFQYLGGTGAVTYAIKDQAGLNKYRGSVFVGGRNNMGGIELRDGKRNSVIGCQFDGVSGDNIFVASSTQNIITNNTFTSIADQATTNGAYTGIHLEYGAIGNVVTGNIMDNSATNGRAHSMIRERAMGDSGSNFILHNVLQPRGTMASTTTIFEPTTSTTTPNYINLIKV